MSTMATDHERSQRLALAHDYLLVMRGAERTFAAIADLYRDAPIFTLLYDEAGTSGRFAGRSVTTSPLQRLGVGQSSFRRLLPLYPWAVERLRPSQCDVVLSSSSAFAHGVCVPPGAVHVCYCYTPFRYAWYEQQRALDETPTPLRPLLAHQLGRIRRWDLKASRRVDSYIAISELSRERIKRYYDRDSIVIHPPVETDRFRVGAPGDSLLVVSEIVRHKRVHIALEAARRAHVPIQIVGSGPDHAALSEAYPEAEFLGRASDEHGGVWDHRRRGAGRGPAGDRRGRRRSAGDRDRRADGTLRHARRRRLLRPGDARARRIRIRPGSCPSKRRTLLRSRLPAPARRAHQPFDVLLLSRYE
jgi:glycosyltransferase involved in cell wall biosynthesis